MTSEQIQARYPRLLRAMQWVAILSTGEAAACLRDYKAGFPWSGEAVNHFGGTKIVLQRAVTARVRHFMVDLRNAERSERLLARINHELAAESAALGGTDVTQDDRPLYVLLHDALEQVRLVDQRLIGLRSALPHATRNVDRRILTNDADSMRLKLSVALESLQDALDMLRQRRNPE